MPLTNPNKVVTEERLSEFYGQILPYMGGMPDVLANKFSKGDLYSTDEKMVGQWTDGKPLYQKTVATGGNVPSGATLIQRTTQTGYDTILYTKTTDSPIAIGSDTDYSTDEKIVGTWIDGRPVWQKTYTVSSVTSSNKLIDSTMKLSAITLVGFISNGIQMGGNYNGTTFVGSITASCSLRVWNDTNGLYCNLENASITATEARFTIQYVKTS